MEAALRELVRQRAGDRCEYCRLPQEFSELRFHIERITPRQHGGTGAIENLALACPDCNLAKGPNLAALQPGGRKIVRLFNPRLDRWSRHFRCDGARIAGRTPVGRASAALLRMNDAERLRIRSLLLGVGSYAGRNGLRQLSAVSRTWFYAS
jgi:hypothetical protein